jgi:hypothetical protein
VTASSEYHEADQLLVAASEGRIAQELYRQTVAGVRFGGTRLAYYLDGVIREDKVFVGYLYYIDGLFVEAAADILCETIMRGLRDRRAAFASSPSLSSEKMASS